MHGPAPALIPVDMLLLAYRSGIFPMADSREDTEIFWVEPEDRAIIPLDNFSPGRTLRKIVRQDRFRVTCDTAFAQVVSACAAPRPGHPESWISTRIADSYAQLHEADHAHSIECWDGETLVGGLYGVSFDRVFCGESMFSRADNASKVALVWLVALLRHAGFMLLDCQFMTDHLASMGAVEISQKEYLRRIAQARDTATNPVTTMNVRDAYVSLVSGASSSSEDASLPPSSPGKLISQSFIQTS
ncbi:MAG: leucyl/phenylalanyl-tRNA--protein transferase [Pontixanthobacter sp.]